MKAVLTALFAMVALAATPLSAQAQSAYVSVVHGIPGVDVDVYVVPAGTPLEAAAPAIPGFQFGNSVTAAELPAGVALDIKIVPAGATTPVVLALDNVTLPEGANLTAVAHLDEAGVSPQLAVVANDLSPLGDGLGRLEARHFAAAPTVDVITSGRKAFTISNGATAAADVPARPYAVWLALPGQRRPAVSPVNVKLEDGYAHFVHAVGSLADGSFRYVTIVLAAE